MFLLRLTYERLFLETPDVANTVGLGYAGRRGGNIIDDKSRVKTLDIGNRVNGSLPCLVDRVENLSVRLHGLVRELNTRKSLAIDEPMAMKPTYRNICLGESRALAHDLIVVTLLILASAGILVKLANWDGGLLTPA